MKTTNKSERLSAAIAAVVVSFLIVLAISDYALPGQGATSSTVAISFPPLAFVAN
jgi:hypothetical protein